MNLNGCKFEFSENFGDLGATTAKRMKIDSIVSGMSLTWAYIHSYSHFCIRKSSKSCEIRQKFEHAVQGHQSWCQSEAHIQLLLIINSNFVRISYRLQDIDA